MRNSTRIAIAALGASLLCAPLYAQDDAKASKEREALRRAQSALRAMTDERDALQADKARLAQDKTKSDQELAALRGRSQGEAGRVKQAEQRADTLQAQLDAAAKARDEAAAASQQREHELQEQLAGARRESNERLQSTRALGTLLEHSTQALAAAEDKNRKLLAVGEDLLKRYQERPAYDRVTIGDPLLGFTDVKLANEAETIRGQMAQLRVAP